MNRGRATVATAVGMLLSGARMAAFAGTATLTVDLGDNGPASLRWGGQELLADSSRFTVAAADAGGKAVRLEGDGVRRTEGLFAVREWPGLEVRSAWEHKGDALRLRLAVRNTGAAALGRVEITPLVFAFPRRPAGSRWWWGYDVMTDNDGSPGLVEADWGSGKVLFSVDQPETPCRAGFRGNFGNSDVNALLIATAVDEQLAAGAERRWSVTLRFAPGGTPTTEMAAELYAAFGKAYPWRLQWPDRRPLGALFLARDNTRWKTNPRGWFNDEKVDVTSPEGLAAFRRRLMETADRSIAVIRETGGQGMVFWDLEGAEMPHAITYLGDPRVLPEAAPEMDAHADEFFRRFRDAGLKTGVCIRPSKVIADGKGGWMHRQVDDAVAEMADKIAYAKKRWGCTVFYLDTNVTWPLRGPEDPTRGMWQGNARLLPSRDIHELARRHPDVLIIPEFGRFGYYGACMPYGELRRDGGDRGVPDGVRAVWPAAGRAIKVGDGDYLGFWDELLDGAVKGDIHIFRGWFGDPVNSLVRRCYQEADLIRRAAGMRVPDPLRDLADEDAARRYAAVCALEPSDARHVAALTARLREESEWVVKRRIIVALGTGGRNEAVAPLAAQMEDAASGLEGFAVRALARLGPQATAHLGRLAAGGDARLREHALGALATCDDPAMAAILLPLTQDASPRTRALAARALGGAPGAGTSARLLALLEDESVEVRRAACVALGRLRERAAIEPLVNVIRRSVTEWHNNDLRTDAGAALEAITGKQHGPFENRWARALERGEL